MFWQVQLDSNLYCTFLFFCSECQRFLQSAISVFPLNFWVFFIFPAVLTDFRIKIIALCNFIPHENKTANLKMQRKKISYMTAHVLESFYQILFFRWLQINFKNAWKCMSCWMSFFVNIAGDGATLFYIPTIS